VGFAHDIIKPHTRGSRTLVPYGGQRGMIGVEEKQKEIF